MRAGAGAGGHAPNERLRERLATRGIGALRGLRGAGMPEMAALQLAARRHPDTALPGLLISLVSLAFMFVLWRAKRRAARALDSRRSRATPRAAWRA